tara:strand:- start:11 stop:703 length:693 start_codon:yes stop_codon:yes gene_type:complete
MSNTKLNTAQVILTDCDDAVEEVKAAMRRLTTVRLQLEAQRAYVESLLAEKLDTSADSTDIQDIKVHDSAIKYRHNQGSNATSKRYRGFHSAGVIGNTAVTSGVRNEIMATTSTLRGTDAEETGGLNVSEVKGFLIGLNALLTNANSATTHNTAAKEAIVGTKGVTGNYTAGLFSQHYVPGGIHRLSDEVFKALLLGATSWGKVNISDQTVAWGATTADTGIETKGFNLS